MGSFCGYAGLYYKKIRRKKSIQTNEKREDQSSFRPEHAETHAFNSDKRYRTLFLLRLFMRMGAADIPRNFREEIGALGNGGSNQFCVDELVSLKRRMCQPYHEGKLD